jgi:26S proteasome non-ATPase regulatory subunit 9
MQTTTSNNTTTTTTTTNQHDALNDKKTTLLSLQSRRSGMEQELVAITQELDSTKGNGTIAVGLKGSLLDHDGFPRSDLDLVRITTLRNRAAILKTDLITITKEMESGLLELHGIAKTSGITSLEEKVTNNLTTTRDSSSLGNNNNNSTTTSTNKPIDDRPFATIRDVTRDSPAWIAGLRTGMLICKFGDITYTKVQQQQQQSSSTSSSTSLSILASQVEEGIPITVHVKITNESPTITQVTLTPRRWNQGAGMLGCVIVPIVSS